MSGKKFTPRLTRPTAGNKYYNTRANGGYSDAIKGSPTDGACDVLSNCVGYAYGRFNEIGGYGYCKYLRPVNAENFIQNAGGLPIGKTPKLGACMVWRKGNTLNSSDGAGHVAIVEQINSSTQVVTSESGWNAAPFWTKIRNKGSDGNWGAGANYTFLGFIYNPAVDGAGYTVNDSTTTGSTTTTGGTNTGQSSNTILRRGSYGEVVRQLQEKLIKLGYDCGPHGADGDFGAKTEETVRKFQKDSCLSVDGVAGPLTMAAIQKRMTGDFSAGDKITVTASLLNVRNGAGISYAAIGTTKKGSKYTLSEVTDGWGRLKERSGWVSLEYCKKIDKEDSADG